MEEYICDPYWEGGSAEFGVELYSCVSFVFYENVGFSLAETHWFTEAVSFGGSKGDDKVVWVVV